MGVKYVDARAFKVVVPTSDKASRAIVNAVTAKGQALISTALQNEVDSAGHKGREFSGAAGQAVAIEPAKQVGPKIVGEVVVRPPADEYWPVIERGRSPGFPVSAAGRAKLKVWARRKLGQNAARSTIRGAVQRVKSRRFAIASAGGKLRRVTKSDDEKALESLVFLIARKIKQKGIPGIAPFGKAARKLNGGEARRIADRTARAFGRRGR